ncbi:SRPBCC family protein [Chryseolinea lacunae]|uniref:SRPBCC domain-containing protein n=1 Tax=Chryseolinea lacunae TaxID=2801331 RepID=A0ABS1KK31_9BACT|nr:SRPBCC domain-containing protein [Chryseolinea lacunae]MBL0739810.1 SRPBCC domain-containing protein [Chryseolinea lacunae]
MNTKTNLEHVDLVITHEFNAPKKSVFNAFGSAEALAEWWGPVECKNSVIKLDFQPGGIFHFKMEKDGAVNYGRFLFGAIEPYDLLEFTNAFADAAGNVVKAPFDIQIPAEIFYRLRFKESQGKTIITLTGTAVNATAEETATLKAITANVQEGFAATFRALEKYLKTVRA